MLSSDEKGGHWYGRISDTHKRQQKNRAFQTPVVPGNSFRILAPAVASWRKLSRLAAAVALGVSCRVWRQLSRLAAEPHLAAAVDFGSSFQAWQQLLLLAAAVALGSSCRV
jgi:hypothetical protein